MSSNPGFKVSNGSRAITLSAMPTRNQPGTRLRKLLFRGVYTCDLRNLRDIYLSWKSRKKERNGTSGWLSFFFEFNRRDIWRFQYQFPGFTIACSDTELGRWLADSVYARYSQSTYLEMKQSTTAPCVEIRIRATRVVWKTQLLNLSSRGWMICRCIEL